MLSVHCQSHWLVLLDQMGVDKVGIHHATIKALIKAPFRPETNFSHSNTSTLWPHKYFLKGAFYLEIFRTRPAQHPRLLVHRQLLLNNFYFAYNSSDNQGVLQDVDCKSIKALSLYIFITMLVHSTKHFAT